jgi:ATP-binding cassette, subfamily B, bacterial
MKTDLLIESFDSKHPFKTLARLLKPRRRRLALAFLLYGIKHSPVWLLPVVTAGVIDVLVEEQPVSALVGYVVIFAVLLGQNLPMNIWFAMTLSKVLRELEVNLRSALTERVQELSIGFWNRMNVGALQSKVVRDVENVELALRQAGNGGFAAVYNFVGGVAITAWKVPEFLIFFLFLVPASGWVLVFTRRHLNKRNEEYRKAVELMGVKTTEMMTLVPVTRSHGLEETATTKVEKDYESTRKAALSLDFVNSSFGALSWVVFHTSSALVLFTAVWASRTGRIDISAGEVVMLTGYFGVLAAAVVILTDLAPNFARGLASLRSIGEVLESDDLEPNRGKPEVKTLRGEIEFKNITFTYPEAPTPAINNLSLRIAAGEYVAVAGASGCGKSTLANLLIGFLRPQKGQVLIDGVDTANVDYRTIRRFISVVPQEAVMFEGSVLDNVGYGTDDVTEAQIMEALEAANAMEFVELLPEGIHTEIGPRGFTLSGGQKQRLAIARALLRNPRILVLDEATSALDNESEQLVQQAFARLMEGRTTFVIAHRLSTIRDADRIIAMDAGQVVEIGSHTELINQDGLYARLHSLSASGELL